MTTLKPPFPWFGSARLILWYNMGMNTEQRFWSKVNKTDSCWIWTASKRNKGYGAFVYPKNGDIVQGRAHRYSWELHNKKDIPDGMCVLHSCDNPACVNPDHLFLGSKAENNADMIAKGRYIKGGTRLKQQGKEGKYKRGIEHPNARLSEIDVRNIRSEYPGTSYYKISMKYQITISSAWKIINNKAWKNVK